MQLLNKNATDAARQDLIRVVAPQASCDGAWEAAYQRFETPDEEIRKFQKRLAYLGAAAWRRDARIAELFCGRGNGLVALQRLGFTQLEGVDLSESLLLEYRGPAKCYLADCRKLPFDDDTKDVLIVQGGLHHLPELPADLERVLREAKRVLRPGGRFVVVEPWRTPFLDGVHAACGNRFVRSISRRVEALATMIEHERETYEQWLGMPDEILALLQQTYVVADLKVRWGKLFFVGRK